MDPPEKTDDEEENSHYEIEDIPKWVADEIKNVKFGKPKKIIRTGYILDIYDKVNKVDISKILPNKEQPRKNFTRPNL